MNNKNSQPLDTGAWYSKEGKDNDVVLSSRVRLARNLVNYPFPHSFKGDDGERVCALVFDAFANIKDAEKYQNVAIRNLEPMGQHILIERGVVTSDIVSQPNSGVIVRMDGYISCTVNCVDHIRLSSFLPGFSGLEAFEVLQPLDSELQKKLQFAASKEFGFLTSNLKDCGSALKLSYVLHLPSIVNSGIFERIFKDFMSRGFNISGYYGTGGNSGTSLGSYYEISNYSCLEGNEQSQLAAVNAAVENLIEIERKKRAELADNKPTIIQDSVLRALAIIQYSSFIGNREGIDLLSRVKWGLDMKLFSGITDAEILSLLYRIQPAHLQYIIRTENLNWEKDITTQEEKIDRLRSIVMKECLEKIKIDG